MNGLRHGFLRSAVVSLVLFLVAAAPVRALIMVGKGNEPVHDPGWPAGALAVANLKSRIGWSEGPPFGGGQWTFYYRGDAEALQETVTAFGGVQAGALEIVLHDGVGTSPFVGDSAAAPDERGFNWAFEVWVPENWNRLYNSADSLIAADQPEFRHPLAAPRLDVWLSGALDWQAIRVPGNVSVRDARASANGFGPGTGSAIRLHAVDAVSSQPVQMLRLIVAGTAADGHTYVVRREATGDGIVTLGEIPSGNCRVSVAAPGFAPRLLEYTSFGANDFKSYVVKLVKPARLSGVAHDEAGKPVPGVDIRVQHTLAPDGSGYPLPEPPEVITDAEGRFELVGLPVGQLQLWAHKTGYHHVWRPRDLVEAVPADDARGWPPVVVQLEATGRLRVQFVDAAGKPVAFEREGEAQVHVQEADRTGVGAWGGSANVAVNGSFEFTSVRPGRYRVSGKPFVPGVAHTAESDSEATVTAGQLTTVSLLRP